MHWREVWERCNLKNKRTALIFSLTVVGFGVLLSFALFRINDIAGMVRYVASAAASLMWGAIIAFIINVPMSAVERLIVKLDKHGRLKLGHRRAIGLLVTLAFMVGLVYMLLTMIIPELLRTLIAILEMIPDLLRRADTFLQSYGINISEMFFAKGDAPTSASDVRQQLIQALDILINGVTFSTALVSSIASAMMDVFFSVLFAVYILVSKERLGVQVRKLLYAFLPERFSDRTVEVCRLMHGTYSSFIAGQCTEALILGGMFFVCMTLFRMPYALLISVFIAVTALIPLVGAWLGCIVGALLILINNPITAIWFVILFLVLQQIEGNLIYPHVVGNSIGLKPMWTLAAVVIGQGLFGIVGMLVFIPLASVIYTLLRGSANERLGKRGVPHDKFAQQ